MTTAETSTVRKLLIGRGYSKVEDEATYLILRNKHYIGLRVDEIEDIIFDMYQASRRGEQKFIPNPRTEISSLLEDSLIFTDWEFLIEKGEVAHEPDVNEARKLIKGDFESLRDVLNRKGYQVDLYIITEGFDI
jgi:hypothetical protein